ncbi:MAG: hypothetical protein ACK50A_00765 [Sphingobacteriaceae bacterium]
MKAILIILISIIFVSCSDKDKVVYSLPSDKDINEIISTIILSDSIPVVRMEAEPDTIRVKGQPDRIIYPIRHAFSVELEKLRVYFPEPPKDTFELTPPLPSRIGVYFDDLIKRGQADNRNFFSKSDSAYFVFQNDTLNHFTISGNLLDNIYTTTKQQEESKEYTYFSCSIPVFSFDKTKAYVVLAYNCYGLCGSGNSYLLSKDNGHWIIKKRKTLWIS